MTINVDVFGDSFATGYGSSSPSTLGYVPLLAAAKGWTVNNHGVVSSMAADQAGAIYATTIGLGSICTYAIGINDARIYVSNAAKQNAFQTEMLAELAWLALPEVDKIRGRNLVAVTYSGVWVDNVTYPGVGRYTTIQNATATFTLYGKTLLIATQQFTPPNSTGQFSVTIDGVSYGTFNGYTDADITTSKGTIVLPSLLIISGLANTAHTVVLTNLAANGTFGLLFDWAAGIADAKYGAGPYVYCGNITRSAAAGYASIGGSDANTAAYNTLLRTVVGQLGAIGLNVNLVDSYSYLNPLADCYTDGVHPNDSGYAHIKDAFLSVLSLASNIYPGAVASTSNTPIALGGTRSYHLISAASTNANLIKGTPGQVYGGSLGNNGVADAYVKLYNKATVPVIGTDVPYRTLYVPKGQSLSLPHTSTGIAFPLGIGVGITALAADTDVTAIAANQVTVDIDWK